MLGLQSLGGPPSWSFFVVTTSGHVDCWLRTRRRADKVTANARTRGALRQAIATAKRDSWRRFCEEASEEHLWDAFKKVTRARGPHRIGTLEVDGQQLYGDAQKATVLMQKFFPPPSLWIRLSTSVLRIM